MEFQEIKEHQTLYLIRQDLFNGEYILTDHNQVFGTLMYDGLARETAVICTAHNNWKLDYDFEPLGKKYILIFDDNEQLVGKITSESGYLQDSPYLLMNDGFQAVFLNENIFSNKYEWTTDKLGCIINIKNSIFSLTNPISIVEKNIDRQKIALLCFLAQHLLILKDRRRKSSY
jgi:hypothetical protein